MKALMLYCGPVDEHPTEAFALLGEYAGRYRDTHGDPDGDVWLPSHTDTLPGELAQNVVEAGLGQIVEVQHATDEGMVNYLNQFTDSLLGIRVRLANNEFDRARDGQRLQEAASAAGLQWAHFGAYGAGDSHWVFVSDSTAEAGGM